jgi:uncharacterized protein (DUF2252 family)
MAALYERILAFNKDLLPKMVVYKYKGMAESAFRFFRGTCHLFYEDLSAAPALPPSPITWACGDLHLENFGSFKADNKLVFFDLNDFDESILMPANWEVVRMLTGIFVAFENLGIEKKKATNMASLFLNSYSVTLSKGKPVSIDPRTAKGIVCTFLTNAAERKQKELLKKRTSFKKHKLALVIEREKQFELDKSLKKALIKTIEGWIAGRNDEPYNYEVLDVIFRLAGTGSVGLKRYLFLLKSLDVEDKYLLLDMKQARVSSVRPYVQVQQPQWANEAERVIALQQRMQNVSPKLMSSLTFDGDAYVLQEMQPMEDSINFELIKDRYRDIAQVIEDMAVLTASAQLRSGGRQGSANADELIAFGENTEWQLLLLAYAKDYSKKVNSDYKRFVKDLKEGKLGEVEE